MKRGLQGAVLRTLGARDHEVRVERVVDVVPGLRRVTFTSPTMLEAFDPGPADYIRLWVPDLADPSREVQRGYTVLDADRGAGSFAVEFVLHDPDGPASRWAARCNPGDTLIATPYGSRAFALATPEPNGLLLVGDAASIPAINSILAAAPAHLRVELIIEYGSSAERDIPVIDHPNLKRRDVPREGAGRGLVAALVGRDWAGWQAWVATERSASKAVRASLVDDHGFPKQDHKVQAYWVQGGSIGASRDAAQPAAERPTAPAGRPTEPAGRPTEPAERPGRGRWRSQAGAELLAPMRSVLRVAAVVQIVVTVLEVAPFVLLAELGRRLLDGQPVDDQWPLARLALVLLGAGTLLSAVLMFVLHAVDARFARAVRRKMLVALARLPLGWFTERNSATVKHAVSDDTASLHYYVTHAAVDVVGAVSAPVAVLAYLFVVDARLAALVLLPVLAYAYVFVTMVRESRLALDEVVRWSRTMSNDAVGYLDGLPVVRVFGGPGASRFLRRIADYVQFLGQWQRPLVARKATSALLTDPITFLGVIVVGGGALVSTGRMNPADLLPFLLLGTTFGARLLALAYNSSGLRESRAAAQRIGLILTEPALDVSGDGATPLGPAVAAIELRGVGFGYRRGEQILADIDLQVPRGTVTALVGPSGAGKSTLAALVARFHDPDSGVVFVGGDDVRTLDADELYRRVGFVLQDVHLVRASLHDNIALARPAASREEVVAIAERAFLGDVVARLPAGFDTVIGRDVELSGGEEQRVAIARALLGDTPVIVLDEATAFADPDSERQVQLALTELLAGRTVLVIAHRLHTVVDADQIVVVDHGRIVQRGSHDQLLAIDGLYRDLWQRRTTAVSA